MQYSANLGFLWADRSLPDAIVAAARAGFVAVECHWPYLTAASEVKSALDKVQLPMLGLNTRRGQTGEFGLSALPGREAEARAAIDEALAYAEAVDAASVHVMAGRAQGKVAHRTFLDALRYACSATERQILIEPLNAHDAPGYFLTSTTQALEIIDDVSAPNLALMFDCYHVGRSEGDVCTRLKHLHDRIGHIQIAAVPDRGAPDHGELHYPAVFQTIRDLGWTRPLGAEYRPSGETDASLGWMKSL